LCSRAAVSLLAGKNSPKIHNSPAGLAAMIIVTQSVTSSMPPNPVPRGREFSAPEFPEKGCSREKSSENAKSPVAR
jgi:hypothetical protein